VSPDFFTAAEQAAGKPRQGDDESPCQRPESDPARSAAGGSGRISEWESGNGPAAGRNARPPGGNRRKPVAATGTRTTPPPSGFSTGRRKPNRQSLSGYRLPCRDFPGISRKTSSGFKTLISLGLWQHLYYGPRKTSSGSISLIRIDFPAHFPCRRKRPVPASAILKPKQATMQPEFHQLDRRWEHLRVRKPHRQGRLIASLAESGQQTPIVVVAAADHSGGYVVLDRSRLRRR